MKPKHGDRAACAACGREIEVTAVATYSDGRIVYLSKHTGTWRQECRPALWDRITSRVDYDEQGGTLATWPEAASVTT